MSFSVVNWSTKTTYGVYYSEQDARQLALAYIGPDDEYSIVELPAEVGAGRTIEYGRGGQSIDRP